MCPHGLLHPTGQILKDLEREIKTDEWKANAMKNNVFENCPMRKASSNEGNKLTFNRRCEKQVSSAPVAGFSAMTLKPVKRFRSSYLSKSVTKNNV